VVKAKKHVPEKKRGLSFSRQGFGEGGEKKRPQAESDAEMKKSMSGQKNNGLGSSMDN